MLDGRSHLAESLCGREHMPRRELKTGQQVAAWLQRVGELISEPGEILLIGSLSGKFRRFSEIFSNRCRAFRAAS